LTGNKKVLFWRCVWKCYKKFQRKSAFKSAN